MKYNGDEDRIEVKSIERESVQDAIFEFVEYFVLCSGCRNPETVLSVSKGDIYLSCKACGKSEKIKMNNKVVKKSYDGMIKLIG